MSFRSFGDQTQHYFNRPHIGVPERAIESAASWRGEEMAADPERWQFSLSTADVAELEAGLKAVHSVPLAEITTDNFPLPSLQPRFAEWRRALDDGCGVVVVTGLPVERWSQAECEQVFWGFGRHLGIPGGQNPDEELLGHVTDYGEEADNPQVRLYRTTSNIDFHCDAADVVGLLCLRPAQTGGASRVVSSVAVFNALLESHTEVVGELFKPQPLDSRGEQKPGRAAWQPIQPAAWDGDRLRTFYHSEYYRSAWRHSDVEPSAETRAMFDAWDAIALELCLDMDLNPGDMQFVSNHSVAHARTGYTDNPAKPRHLLRLWLSLLD